MAARAQRPWPFRRPTLAGCLFGGALLSLAIAWSRVIIADTRLDPFGWSKSVHVYNPTPLNSVTWCLDRISVDLEQWTPRPFTVVTRGGGVVASRTMLEKNGTRSSSGGPAAVVKGSVQQIAVCHIESGWPISCMQGVCWGPATVPMQFSRALPINLGILQSILPLSPMPLGYLVNTVVLGSLLWIGCALPWKLRGMLRNRRNQCPACAYPVGTSNVCTECGHAFTSPACRA
jgi:hypothetical protein